MSDENNDNDSPDYLQRFQEGLGFRPVEDFRYVGGDRDNKLTWYQMQCPGQAVPAHSDRCICGHPITVNCFIQHKVQKDVLILGSCCIKKFIPTAARNCARCFTVTSNRSDPWCNTCRGGMMQNGEHMGRSFRWILDNDSRYCQASLRIGRSRANTKQQNDFLRFLNNEGLAVQEPVARPTFTLPQPPVADPVKDKVITFGKHKDKLTYQQIWERDFSYCTWVISLTESTGAMKQFREWLVKKQSR